MTTLQTHAQLSDDLVSIVGDVWESFLLGDIEQLPPKPPVSGLVTCAHVCLSGAWEGVIMVECPADAATALSVLLLGLEPGQASELDIADTLGEIANVIGGNLKNVLPGPTLLSLPVVARSMSPSFVKDARQICTVDFRWDSGDLRVVVWSAQG